MINFSDDPRSWMNGPKADALTGYVDGLSGAGTITPEVATEILRRCKAYSDQAARVARAEIAASHAGKVFLQSVMLTQEQYDEIKAKDPNALYPYPI